MKPTVKRRRGLTLIEVVVIAVILALAMVVLLPGIGSRPLSTRAVCASNLRGIGQGLIIYAGDNGGAFPQHYFETDVPSGSDGGTHGVTWIGAMGSHGGLRISQQTSPTTSPRRSHPSRSLYLLVITGMASLGQFICPESGDTEDELRNIGPDAHDGEDRENAQPGRSRFDFQGYNSLSYGYQLPFGPAAQPHSSLDAKMPIAADKGPYFEAGSDALLDSHTTSDRSTKVKLPPKWSSLSAERLNALGVEAWTRFNSRNHRGEAQTVFFVDGHAEFAKTPLAGLRGDNIYTLNRRPGDDAAGMLGTTPADAPLEGPRLNSDSYIVP